MNLYIKNMVCNRCIMVVKQELDKLGIEHGNVNLGEVELKKPLTAGQLGNLSKSLDALGFELLDDGRQKIIEKIKNVIIQHIHHNEDLEQFNFSSILSSELHRDYSYLSKLFSEVEGITIEKYIIHQKIEKVKELIMYKELNLSEIAFKLGYSSVAHLSSQFKKVTGLTPSHFREVAQNKRKPLDKV